MGWQVTFDGTRRPVDEYIAAVKDDPFATVWEGGKVVDLDDLSPDVFEKIAKQDDEANWWGVYRFPAGSSVRMIEVLRAAAEHAGVPAPAAPSNMRESRLLLDMIEQTRDPDPRERGFPTKLSTEEDSSPGQSGDSIGSPLPPDESE